MGKLALTSLAVAVLVLTGCSQKSPEVDMTKGTSDTKGTTDGMSALQKLIASLEANSKTIYFDFDKYNIRPDADAELQQMAKILKDNPTYTGILKAHTDSKGSDEYNQVLSQNRAKEAKKVLVAAGIEAARIETTASSEAAPIASNTDDDSGRKFNRRVELYVVDANKKEVCKSIPPQVPDSLKGN